MAPDLHISVRPPMRAENLTPDRRGGYLEDTSWKFPASTLHCPLRSPCPTRTTPAPPPPPCRIPWTSACPAAGRRRSGRRAGRHPEHDRPGQHGRPVRAWGIEPEPGLRPPRPVESPLRHPRRTKFLQWRRILTIASGFREFDTAAAKRVSDSVSAHAPPLWRRVRHFLPQLAIRIRR